MAEKNNGEYVVRNGKLVLKDPEKEKEYFRHGKTSNTRLNSLEEDSQAQLNEDKKKNLSELDDNSSIKLVDSFLNQKGSSTNKKKKEEDGLSSSERTEKRIREIKKLQSEQQRDQNKIDALKKENFDGSLDSKINKLEKKIDKRDNKITKKYEQQSGVVQDIRNRRNSLTFNPNTKASTYKETQKASSELEKRYRAKAQSDPKNASAYTRKADKYASKAQKAGAKVNKYTKQAESLNNFVNKTPLKYGKAIKNAGTAVRQGARKAVHSAGQAVSGVSKGMLKALGTGLKAVLQFLFTTPIGWLILIALIILIIIAISVFATPEPPLNNLSADYVSEYIVEQDIEYMAWLNKFDEDYAEFYDDYHTNVTANKIVPIIYTFIDDVDWNNKRDEAYANFDINDYDTVAEYEHEVFKYAIDNYIGEFDPYSLREMYLDRVEFTHMFLDRSWSSWTVANGGMSEPIHRDSVGTYEENFRSDAMNHDEWLDYQEDIEVYWYEEVDDYGYVEVENIDPKTGKKYYTEEWQKTGSHQERRSSIETITKYKYRDITEQKWVKSSASLDADDIYTSERLQRLADNAKIPQDYKQEDDPIVGTPWIVREYDSNGYIYEETHRWILRDFDAVVEDIVNVYNPVSEEYPKGDKITVKKTTNKSYQLGKEITIEFEIDRKLLYKQYYTESPDYYQENMFTEEYCEKALTKIKAIKELFDNLYTSIDLNVLLVNYGEGGILPLAESRELWQKIIAMADQYGIYGADYNCTQFVSFLLYQEYGITHIAGDGKTKVSELINSGNGFEYSTEPAPGSVFSVDYGDIYGHTGWVDDVYYDEELGMDMIVISEGNANASGDINSAIRIKATYSLNDWKKRYGSSISYAVKA